MTRSHARAAPGARAVGKLPGGHWQRLTVLGALGLEGVVASMSLADRTRRVRSTTAVFLAFVKRALLPALRGRSDVVVVMGNLGARTRPSRSAAPSRRPRSAIAICRPTRRT